MTYYNESIHGPVKYYRSDLGRQVIGVVNGHKPMFFWFNTDDSPKELFNMTFSLEEGKYVEIVPPKTGDIIRLTKNMVNRHSPNVNQDYEVENPEDGFRFYVRNLNTDQKLLIDSRKWVWSIVEPKQTETTIGNGDIITKDGKQFTVTLTEVPQQKYKVGDIVGDRIILETKLKNGKWYYESYHRPTKGISEIGESILTTVASLYNYSQTQK